MRSYINHFTILKADTALSFTVRRPVCRCGHCQVSCTFWGSLETRKINGLSKYWYRPKQL